MPIRFECKNSCVALIDIDLGNKNTFNISEMNELIKIFEEHIEKELDLKAILIKSSNADFYATGPAVKEIKNLDKDGARYYITILNRMTKHIQESPVPVICVVKGAVSGIGFDIVSSADFRFALKDTVFADVSSKYGLLSPSSIALRLSFLIGVQRAKEIILSGKDYSGRDLYNFNFLTNIFDADEIDTRVDDFLNKFKELSIDSLRLKKRFFIDLWKNYIKNNQFPVDDIFSELLKSGKDWKKLLAGSENKTL
ncbi:MAG: enoyl-CoA hydratase/isomerase family protein [Candidatus Acidulodesulfobacterium ferriphilum]|jgi:enoyl-CoA hydratase/carnithine racemase|uniref:Enoyl-CoA hydratase/isomerase family protein n=1 Tax=Candidatus Acidulodesulfobacterium ferriphilum TaxID=2597223 RepID=A0A519BBI8_9DELT|nr:MAG: enoyl-CoA hydratase/isomerase family protein [Candidatus Acidulodesulfobacterium ferriphilum]